MPIRYAASATSPDALSRAIANAPDVGAVWHLLRQWRKKRVHALGVAFHITPYWDEGLVLALTEYPDRLPRALGNPSWPQWANDALVAWSVQTLGIESMKVSLFNAQYALSVLARYGRFAGTSDAALELAETLDGRPSIAHRQMVAALTLLNCADLPQDRFDHVATALERGKVISRSCGDGECFTVTLAALEHPMMTDARVRLWFDIVPERLHDAFLEDVIGRTSSPRWKGLVAELSGRRPKSRGVSA